MSEKSIRRQIQERLGFQTQQSTSVHYPENDEYLIGNPFQGDWYVIPYYELDMEDAWKLVEKMTECEYVKVSCETSHYHGYFCHVICADESQRRETDIVKRDGIGHGQTMTEAICKAFLMATEEKEQS